MWRRKSTSTEYTFLYAFRSTSSLCFLLRFSNSFSITFAFIFNNVLTCRFPFLLLFAIMASISCDSYQWEE